LPGLDKTGCHRSMIEQIRRSLSFDEHRPVDAIVRLGGFV